MPDDAAHVERVGVAVGAAQRLKIDVHLPELAARVAAHDVVAQRRDIADEHSRTLRRIEGVAGEERAVGEVGAGDEHERLSTHARCVDAAERLGGVPVVATRVVAELRREAQRERRGSGRRSQERRHADSSRARERRGEPVEPSPRLEDPARGQDREETDSLEGEARARLAEDGFAPDRIEIRRSASLHYQGQSFELRVPLAAGRIDPATLLALEEAFGAEHERTYGHRAGAEEPVELVSLEVIGRGLPDQALAQVKAARPTLDYDLHYGSETGFVTTAGFVEQVFKDLSNPQGKPRVR